MANSDASMYKEDGSYNGYLYSWETFAGYDELTFTMTIADASALSAETDLFYVQVYDTNWGGWDTTSVKVKNLAEADGVYTATMEVDAIKALLSSGGELRGINISYAGDSLATTVTLTGLYGVVLPEAADPTPTPSVSGETTQIGGPYVANSDASMYKEDGSYNGYLYSWESFAGYDELTFTMTIADASALSAETDLFYVQVYDTNWGGWDTTSVKVKNLAEADGVYTATMEVDAIKALLSSGGELRGINISYAGASLATTVTLTGLYGVKAAEADPAPTTVPVTSASLDYMKAMGDGWNLGNSFDGVNTGLDEEDLGETAWGNPEVVKELIQAVADKGYDSIRIPVTFYRRYDEETYVIDEAWLARVKEVVQWSLDEGLHVMINVHHDSWLWLSAWDGNTESKEYVKFTKIWEQFAAYFKDMPLEVCFETINEPTFEATGNITAQDKLDMVNQAAYDAIRNSGGNNATRMIVIPTMTTNHGEQYCNATIKFINALNDENVMATVHYYSEWVHSAGIGKTGFDEVLWQNNGEDYTPRDSVDLFYETLQEKFLDNGIGVVVGEWGLLGYDSASQVNQAGEELKYYEYMNYYANEKDVCLMFWDNGSGINRTSGNYEWKKPLVGEMLETSMSERSAYVTDLDRVFFNAEATEDVTFKLTLNGLTFSGIEGLTEGTDYTYNGDTATVTLSKAYVNAKYAEVGDKYGTFADLVFKFSGGADWHEYLIKYATAVATETSGTTADIKIPVDFKGSEVRRATAYMASGKVGPNSSWWDYLQYGGAFLPDYETGTIAILSGFWNDSTVVDGEITFHFEMYDGSVMKYTLVKDGTNVTGYPALDAADVTMECASEICVYVGETEIKDTYFNVPEGTGIYGTYPWDATDHIILSGWPATMTFGSQAQQDSIKIGLMLTYMDRTEYPGDITFWLKDAPTVDGVNVKTGTKANVTVNNLAENAQVSYAVENPAVAVVTQEGVVTGISAGTTKVIATVTQYGRTDSFEAVVTVAQSVSASTSEPVATPAPVVATSPKTDDMGSMLFWLALMAMSAGIACVSMKKREENL